MKSLKYLLALGLASMPVVVRAAHVSFIEIGETEIHVIPDANWEFGVQVGNPTPETAFANGGFFTVSQPGAGSAVAFMLEPGSRDISDIMRIDWEVVPDTSGAAFNIAHVNINFTSDGETPLGTLPAGVPAVIENGDDQVLNGFFLHPTSLAPIDIPANITISALSDVEAIPTPAAALGGFALFGGLVAARRLRRKN